jgi:hypothetical protein
MNWAPLSMYIAFVALFLSVFFGSPVLWLLSLVVGTVACWARPRRNNIFGIRARPTTYGDRSKPNW